jgi:hypothetical protein
VSPSVHVHLEFLLFILRLWTRDSNIARIPPTFRRLDDLTVMCPTSGIIWEQEILEHDEDSSTGVCSNLADILSILSIQDATGCEWVPEFGMGQ